MRKLYIAIGVIFGFLVVTSIQAAAQEIHGCVSNKNGKLRIVSDPSECNIKKEASISWNVEGQQGPEGPQGEQGPPGECDPAMIDDLQNQIDALQATLDAMMRFTDLGDGTVLDNITGEVWLKDANCFGRMNWDDAMAAAAELKDGQCGLSDGSEAGDWHLPDTYAWTALVDMRFSSPVLCNTTGTRHWSEGDPFTGVGSSPYWSSTYYAWPNYVWYIHLNDGGLNDAHKDGSLNFVWPLREDGD